MLRVTAFALTSLCLIMPATAFAQAPAPSPQTQAAADAASIDIIAKKLCQGEPVVGTRIPIKKKCDTPAQLAQYQAQAREMIENYRRRPCMMGAESANNQAMPC